MARILFLAHRIPYPPNKGDKIRSWHFLQHLAAKHEVHLGYFVDDAKDLVHTAFLEEHVASQCFQFIDKKWQKLLSARGLLTGDPLTLAAYPKGKIRSYVASLQRDSDIDLVFLFSAVTADLIDWGAAPVLADLVDVDSAKWAAYAGNAPWPLSAVYAREARKLGSFEKLVSEYAEATVFVSEQEAALFREGLSEDVSEDVSGDVASKVSGLPNGVDTEVFDPERYTIEKAATAPPEVIFTGAMDYAPNVEAIRWFVAQVWPLVRQEAPSAILTVAGGPVHSDIRTLNGLHGIRVLGYVDDMAESIAAADVVVAPLQTARGIQNKVLEGMAMAKPVVATSAAKEGIDADSGTHLCVEDEPRLMAARILAFLNDPEARFAMGQAARSHICSRYSWRQSLDKLDGLIESILGAGDAGHEN